MTAPAEIWIEMQLPPSLTRWISDRFAIPSRHLLDFGLERAADTEVFRRARAVNACVVSKDVDFANIVRAEGPPPAILWMRCGNASTSEVTSLLERLLPSALELVSAGEGLIELVGRP